MYAIIEACGKQYKVSEGDIVFMERLDNEEGTTVTFDQVLLVSDDNKTEVGAPTVKNAKVTATV
ncbi:MAG: 50S ribosomal protein L21, partial [Clostridia bacterium]|nr:50S ribosomal protein L21 [Clostridia bacterium]